MKKVLLIDHYDSFTYNIKHYFESLNINVDIYKCDDTNLLNIDKLNFTHLVLSPGPGNPNQASMTLNIIQKYYQQCPMLGICLGHQAIAHAFGAKITRAKAVMHGKVSMITHNGTGIFKNITNSYAVTRYHSLIIEKNSLPQEFQVDASVSKNPEEIMAISHKNFPVFGVQFHPEAILSQHGHELLKNFIEL